MQENNRDFSLLKKNILLYLDFKKITKYEFYQKTGISNGILSQNNGLSEDNLLRFLSYFKDINPTWLITGEGEMLLGKGNAKEETKKEKTPIVYKETKERSLHCAKCLEKDNTIALLKEINETQKKLIIQFEIQCERHGVGIQYVDKPATKEEQEQHIPKKRA